MYYLIIILVIVLSILFLKYQTNTNNKKTESFINTTYNNQLIKMSKKPFIWIYIEETYNSRDWKTFYSRLSKGNTPSYIWLCLYSVYLNCFQDLIS